MIVSVKFLKSREILNMNVGQGLQPISEKMKVKMQKLEHFENLPYLAEIKGDRVLRFGNSNFPLRTLLSCAQNA